MSTAIANLPVHLITGFLGSGKSTLIHRLIERKPAEERWAVLINEFGQVGIDQAMFAEREDLVVKGLPGGCLCCQLAFVMQATLVNLLHRHRPDRLIIEPSGLGHPAGLLEVLRGEAFQGVLERHHRGARPATAGRYPGPTRRSAISWRWPMPWP